VQSKSPTTAFRTHADTFEALYRTVVADTHRKEAPLESVQAEAVFGSLFAKACHECDQVLDVLEEIPGTLPKAPRKGASNIEKRWHGMRHLEIGGRSLRDIVEEAYQAYRDEGHHLHRPRSEFPDWPGWEHSFGQAMYHRRLFTTVEGYFGIGPRTLYTSDRICLLKGCALPLIVRPNEVGEPLQVVGECYIQGYMNGEALQNERLKWEKIRFC
jgi:hypothetical protein